MSGLKANLSYIIDKMPVSRMWSALHMTDPEPKKLSIWEEYLMQEYVRYFTQGTKMWVVRVPEDGK
jgi:hypothetical protein